MIPSRYMSSCFGAALFGVLGVGAANVALASESIEKTYIGRGDSVYQTGTLPEFAHSSVKSFAVPEYPSDKDRGAATTLRNHCIAIFSSKHLNNRLSVLSFPPSRCISLLTTVQVAQVAEPGHPTRGGAGGSGPEGVGGRGGVSGNALEQRDVDSLYPELIEEIPRAGRELISYCISVLKSRGRRPVNASYTPADCAYYLLALDRKAAPRRDHRSKFPTSVLPQRGTSGADGPSIDGGIGGPGGRAGSGYGGGRGGAGGAGVSGGFGGAGGAGGASQ